MFFTTCVSPLIYFVLSSVASPRHQIREQYCFLDLPGDRQRCSGLLTTDLQQKPLDSELRLVREGGSRSSEHRARLITRCALASDLDIEENLLKRGIRRDSFLATGVARLRHAGVPA